MTEDIKGLIEKINQEGIKKAQESARRIEEEARRQAEEIIARAKKEAQKMILEAKDEIARYDEKERSLLVQAGRDFLLSLKKEINAMLQRLISSDVHQALSAETLARIITEMTKSGGQHKEEIIIALNKEDLKSLEKGFLLKLKEAAKKGIILKESQDIRSGFTISFDNGRSCFDFTDKAIAEYIGESLKPKLAEILKSATK